MLGGEALEEPLWRRLSTVPGTTAYNFYGPTECTGDALYCRVGETDRPALGPRLPEQSLRAGIAHYNTAEEVDGLLSALSNLSVSPLIWSRRCWSCSRRRSIMGAYTSRHRRRGAIVQLCAQQRGR